MTKTFFLGLGGQKCGSTWIQAYLNRQPGSDFGRLGEYQVWEHHLCGVFARYKVTAPSAVDTLRARAKRALGASEPATHLRWRLQSDPQAYSTYFADLLNQPGIVRTGDITPSYAALPAAMLRQIANGLTSHGIHVKAVFSMRDPVDRIRSHMRMEMAKGRLPATTDNTGPLRSFYASDEAAARTRYDQTLEAMHAAFSVSDIHLCLFETLFTPQGIADLARFADVDIDPEAGQTAVNARAKGTDVPDDLTAEIARHYRPVYEATARYLPQIEEVWPSARIALA